MCGINGIISREPIEDISKLIKNMNFLIQHRGPDGSGEFVYQDKVALAMQRLAIIDIKGGSQPMFAEQGDLVLVFNGEIYNYHDLRKELEKKKVTFPTDSDTEVIIKGFSVFGVAFLSQLNGMFSIAIFHMKLRKIWLVRDRLGEKPFYVFNNNNQIIFSSELKSIQNTVKKINLQPLTISKTGLNLFLSLSYIPSPFTIYEEVSKVQPGTYWEINIDTLSIDVKSFWNLSREDQSNNYKGRFIDAKSDLKNLLFESVEKRMVSDVPLGSFLSGGVDSSIISAIMADINSDTQIETFSVGFKKKEFDEAIRAEQVARHIGSKHHSIELDYNKIQDNLNDILLNYDEPFGDSSALASYFLATETKKYVTVALTGDGGDEVFGGYNRYFMASIANQYRKFVPNFLHSQIIKPIVNSINKKDDQRGKWFRYQKFINGIGVNEKEDMLNIMSLANLPNTLNQLLKPELQYNVFETILGPIYDEANFLKPLHRARYLDTKISLEGDMLTKVDRSSMLVSLECRTPMLDHRLVEFSYQLPDDFLIKNTTTKYILKETFKNMLPNKLFESSKLGFGVPVGDWLRDNLNQELRSFIDTDFLDAQNIFQVKYVQELVGNHLNSTSDKTFQVWSFYCFQKWWLKNL